VRISRQAYDQVEGKLGVTYRSLREQRLKNIPRPIGVYAAEFGGDGTGVAAPALKQEIKYCRAPDGTRLAYATVGQGPVLVKAANWLNHLELDWDGPAWRPLMIGLAQDHTFDPLRRPRRRHVGLGCRQYFIRCLGERSGKRRGGERCGALCAAGKFQGSSIAIAYAARHPERVSHLILCRHAFAGADRLGRRQSGFPANVRVSDNITLSEMTTTIPIPPVTGLPTVTDQAGDRARAPTFAPVGQKIPAALTPPIGATSPLGPPLPA
jgi:hypothetical protein